MMTPIEFAGLAVGLPWVKWRSDWAGMDCFGLVVLWFREVLGIELGNVPRVGIVQGLAEAADWAETDTRDGRVIWMAWAGGEPKHCGVFLDERRALHCDGSEEKPGSVRITTVSALYRMYGHIKLYRYTPC